MLPLVLALGSAALSAKQAQDQKQDLRRQGDLDAMIQSGKTAYSGFTGGPAGEFKAQAAGPSVFGNALAGGIAGFSQGQAIGQAGAEDGAANAYKALLSKQAQQGPTTAGQPFGVGNPYKQMMVG